MRPEISAWIRALTLRYLLGPSSPKGGAGPRAQQAHTASHHSAIPTPTTTLSAGRTRMRAEGCCWARQRAHRQQSALQHWAGLGSNNSDLIMPELTGEGKA